MRDVVGRAAEEATPGDVEAHGPAVEIPVCYGGRFGPDLPWSRRGPAARRTTSSARTRRGSIRVFMLGFLPGFPYMASVDDRIAMPRRDEPRARVAAGSVGIAGRQTGIYPFDSPGGWQIIGRTPLVLFDPRREPPALLAPGQRVRFRPIAPSGVRGSARGGWCTMSLVVHRPGLLTTVQDLGRWGHQSAGVPVAGPMDAWSHRLANRLLGNAPSSRRPGSDGHGPAVRMRGGRGDRNHRRAVHDPGRRATRCSRRW